MLGSANLGSIGVFGFYCNFVNFNFIPLGYGELLAKTTLEPKFVRVGLGEHPKNWDPLLISATVAASIFKFGTKLGFCE